MIHSTSSAIHRLAVEMDNKAEKVLKSELGISYSRFYFLYIASQHSAVSQHAIAAEMGYSDPLISKLAADAHADGLIAVVVDPTHKRRRLVSLTNSGQDLLTRSLTVLDTCFSTLASDANIDEQQYIRVTNQLINALNISNKETI